MESAGGFASGLFDSPRDGFNGNSDVGLRLVFACGLPVDERFLSTLLFRPGLIMQSGVLVSERSPRKTGGIAPMDWIVLANILSAPASGGEVSQRARYPVMIWPVSEREMSLLV